jgi:hypothetical protein
MRYSLILLSTCAAICLSVPTVSLADPPQDRNQADAQRAHQAQAGGKGQPQAAHAPAGGQPSSAGGQRSPQGQAARTGRTNPAGQGHQELGQAAQSAQVRQPPNPAAVPGPKSRAARPAVQGGQSRGQVANRVQPGPSQARARSGSSVQAPQVDRRAPTFQAPLAAQRRARPPSSIPTLSGWDRTLRGSDRDQRGQQWRGQYHNWDQQAPWRGNSNWWRSDPGFRLFSGQRLGFFFFPGYGYVTAPREYEHRYWSAGDSLPSWFWRYRVTEYWRYGLPTPPDGCAWVWLDGDVALVDLDDGYILDIVHNVW